MSDVNSVASGLQVAFALPEGALKVQRATRLWVEVDRGQFPAVFDYLVKKENFTILCTITGLDLGADLGFIYHLARDGGIMANLKTRCPKGGSIPSVTPTFPGASIYEAELVDLLGARVDGLPPGPRYPLPEDWPEGEHPLLKDWKPKESPAAPGGPAAASGAPAAGAAAGAPPGAAAAGPAPETKGAQA
jgi:membrane-bound hydrogenase subunit beta